MSSIPSSGSTHPGLLSLAVALGGGGVGCGIWQTHPRWWAQATSASAAGMGTFFLNGFEQILGWLCSPGLFLKVLVQCWLPKRKGKHVQSGGGGLWFGPSWEINPGMSLAASGSKPGMGHQGGFRPLSSACPWCAASIGSVGKMRSIRKHFPSWSEPGSLDQARSSRGKRWEGDSRVGCRGLP